MRARSVLEIGVAVATALSAGLLAIMLASPWLPHAADARFRPAIEATLEPSVTPDGEQPPIGLYLLRGPFSFGPCLGLELSAESYPVAEDAEGTATVLWWQRGMTGCDARTGEIHEIIASVARDIAEDDGHLVGYAVDFVLPLDPESEQSVAAQITILAAQSTGDLLQALDTSAGSSGFGLVLDRVAAVNPILNPLPSAGGPTAAVPPRGTFLTQGPLDADGPCLVIELGQDSYPDDPGVEGVARVRSWQPAVPDPGDPAQCLFRRGDIQEADASVAAALDPNGIVVAYDVIVSVRIDENVATRSIELTFDVAQRSPDRLEATVVEPDLGPRVFDRVDSIDPPLGPPPSASPGA